MINPTYTPLLITLGSSGTTTRGLLYPNFCTNFNHDGVSPTFTGNAKLSGGSLVNQVSGVLTSIGSASDMTFTVSLALWTSSIQLGQFLLWASNFTQGLNHSGFFFTNGTFSEVITRIDASIACQYATVISSTSVSGYGTFEALGNSQNLVTLAATGFDMNLTRGGSCPV